MDELMSPFTRIAEALEELTRVLESTYIRGKEGTVIRIHNRSGSVSTMRLIRTDAGVDPKTQEGIAYWEHWKGKAKYSE